MSGTWSLLGWHVRFVRFSLWGYQITKLNDTLLNDYLLEYLGMNKPYVDNPKYFIKKNCWFLVAWWIGYKWKEVHWDYKYVRSREEWEKLLNDLKKSEWKNND